MGWATSNFTQLVKDLVSSKMKDNPRDPLGKSDFWTTLLYSLGFIVKDKHFNKLMKDFLYQILNS